MTVAAAPKAILFGLGRPAGILDATPARATMRNKFTERKPNLDRDERICGALTFQPLKSTTLILQGARDNRNWNRAGNVPVLTNDGQPMRNRNNSVTVRKHTPARHQVIVAWTVARKRRKGR